LVAAPLDRKPPRIAHEIKMPVVIDGRPVLLPIRANGQLNLTVGADENHGAEADLVQALSHDLPGSSAVMVINSTGMAWQWELPGGRAFSGATLRRTSSRRRGPRTTLRSSPTNDCDP
jgi:hypothetical protein